MRSRRREAGHRFIRYPQLHLLRRRASRLWRQKARVSTASSGARPFNISRRATTALLAGRLDPRVLRPQAPPRQSMWRPRSGKPILLR